MLTIAKEKEIRDLVRDTSHASNKTIARVAGASCVSVQRIRRLIDTIEKLGIEKSKQIRKLLLQGLSPGSVMAATGMIIETVRAVQRYYFLQPRKTGLPVDRCPTCSSMMFDEDFKLRRALTKKSGKLLPPNISEEQAVALYRVVVDLCELDKLCIVTNPLFYYLAQRAKETLGEVHGDEEEDG